MGEFHAGRGERSALFPWTLPVAVDLCIPYCCVNSQAASGVGRANCTHAALHYCSAMIHLATLPRQCSAAVGVTLLPCILATQDT